MAACRDLCKDQDCDIFRCNTGLLARVYIYIYIYIGNLEAIYQYIYIYIYTHIIFQRVKRLQAQNYASIAPSTYSASFVGWHDGIGCQPPAFSICFHTILQKSKDAIRAIDAFLMFLHAGKKTEKLRGRRRRRRG